MFRIFGSKHRNTTAHDDAVRCIAVQELPLGGIRTVRYVKKSDGIQIVSMESGHQHPGQNSAYEYSVCHMPDDQYVHGVVHNPQGSEHAAYRDMHTQGHSDAALVSLQACHSDYTGYVGITAEAVTRGLKQYPTYTIDSGLLGLAKLFGFGNDDMFIYVAIERSHTVLAVIRGELVLEYRVIPIGTSVLIRAVADTLACPTDMARSIVEKYGVRDTHHDPRLRNKIINVLAPILNTISQLSGSIREHAYAPEHRRGSIRYCVVGGVGANLPGIGSLLHMMVPEAELYEGIARQYKKMIVELPDGPTRQVLPRYYTVLGLVV